MSKNNYAYHHWKAFPWCRANCHNIAIEQADSHKDKNLSYRRTKAHHDYVFHKLRVCHNFR